MFSEIDIIDNFQKSLINNIYKTLTANVRMSPSFEDIWIDRCVTEYRRLYD
jgi:hypothetical protein